MKRPWQSDLHIDVERAVGLLEGQFPELGAVSVERLGEGWDNLALLVNSKWVFRFPRRTIAVSCMEAELSALPLLPLGLGLEVPRLRFVGERTADYPSPFAGYAYLPGRTGCCSGWTRSARAGAARPLGEFLRRLHGTKISAELAAGVPLDVARRADLPFRLAACRERLPAVARLAYDLDLDRLEAALEHHAAAAPFAGPPRLVHGDLYPRHLLVSESGEVRGVFDWGDVHRGDPALDLSIAYTLLPREARAEFEEAYGGIDPATRDRAVFRALNYGLLLALYGHDTGDQALADVARRVLLEWAERASGGLDSQD